MAFIHLSLFPLARSVACSSSQPSPRSLGIYPFGSVPFGSLGCLLLPPTPPSRIALYDECRDSVCLVLPLHPSPSLILYPSSSSTHPILFSNPLHHPHELPFTMSAAILCVSSFPSTSHFPHSLPPPHPLPTRSSSPTLFTTPTVFFPLPVSFFECSVHPARPVFVAICGNFSCGVHCATWRTVVASQFPRPPVSFFECSLHPARPVLGHGRYRPSPAHTFSHKPPRDRARTPSGNPSRKQRCGCFSMG